jgi:hypothetical protein
MHWTPSCYYSMTQVASSESSHQAAQTLSNRQNSLRAPVAVQMVTSVPVALSAAHRVRQTLIKNLPGVALPLLDRSTTNNVLGTQILLQIRDEQTRIQRENALEHGRVLLIGQDVPAELIGLPDDLRTILRRLRAEVLAAGTHDVPAASFLYELPLTSGYQHSVQSAIIPRPRMR